MEGASFLLSPFENYLYLTRFSNITQSYRTSRIRDMLPREGGTLVLLWCRDVPSLKAPFSNRYRMMGISIFRHSNGTVGMLFRKSFIISGVMVQIII